MTLPHMLESPKKTLHERVTDTLRSDLLCYFHPGVKLPSESQLAKDKRVNVHTIRQALSVLAHEGLIERRHGSGTYVTDHRRRKGVAVATVAENGKTPSSFQTRLFLLLSELFRREGYRCRSYVAPLGHLEGWAELAEDVEQGRIMGAAFVAMNAESIKIPFAEKGVAFVGPDDALAPIGWNYFDLVRTGVRHLLDQGCRKIAFMYVPIAEPPFDPLRETFRAALAEQGIVIHDEWIHRAGPLGSPRAGREQFHELWSARDEKPDGLLVTDDVYFNDVTMAILEARIDVPRQLRIVSHANKGSRLNHPFPVDLLEVDVDAWAEAIVQQLIAMMNHKPAAPYPQGILRLVPAGTKAADLASEGVPTPGETAKGVASE